jgi:splicing factor 45
VASAQKAKAKAIASKFSQPPAQPTASAPPPSATVLAIPNEPALAAPVPVKTSIADWTATASDDEVATFYGEKRARGGRKKRKKNRDAEEFVQNWDDIYDPSRPNSYEEYKNSEEKIREVREWKDLLYAHRMKRKESSEYESDESDRRPMNSKKDVAIIQSNLLTIVSESFAPPPMSFAPPPNLNRMDSPPPPPPAEIPDDATGEDAYARRMRMSQQSSIQPPPPPPPPPPMASIPPPGQISRAPVRYTLPLAPADIPSTEAEFEAKLANDQQPSDEPDIDEPRSSRPGQAGFAERLLSKYGWTKGSGLGAQGTGIINPLYAKADKRKKKSDAEGGGFVTPATTGKILGGNKSKVAKEEEEGKFGAMSEVIRLEGMLNGMDLDVELSRDEGGIMQEIGEECGEKYGSVERVYIHQRDDVEGGALVFVQFVNQLSALRAVNALEGRVFNGNVILARFWAREKFEKGVYT